MTYFIICLVALLGSCLTFFSGFGLGTLLTPVFGLFFPIELAIAMTAIVHLLNNLFKWGLTGKHIDWQIVKRFGTPSVLGALAGAFVLKYLSKSTVLIPISLGIYNGNTNIVKIAIGILLIVFALWEIVPALAKLTFDKQYLPLGGLLSGFFGGLSGNQGALRSAFLIKLSLNKETFIATGILIACLIDVTRLSIYFQHFQRLGNQINFYLIGAATLSAFIGAYLGNTFLKKITHGFIQKVVAVLLILFGILLILGII